MIKSLPRMRGDRPRSRYTIRQRMSFTPHARGSTAQEVAEEEGMDVYPACAGIDLLLCWNCIDLVRLPRMRGDRPCPKGEIPFPFGFTPHARGSTQALSVER